MDINELNRRVKFLTYALISQEILTVVCLILIWISKR
jgi:hypothetical protein